MLRRKIASEVRERDLLRKQFPFGKKVADEVTALQIQVRIRNVTSILLEYQRKNFSYSRNKFYSTDMMYCTFE